MQIRPFNITDQTAVIALWQACGLLVPWNDPAKDIQRKLKVDPELFLVGELKGQIIASVMGAYDGHRGWINYLAVAPEHRKKSLGRNIMAAIEERILQKGCPKINLQIRSSNANTLAFYNSLGYQQDDCISLGKRLIPDL